jgi:hypothetical protein
MKIVDKEMIEGFIAALENIEEGIDRSAEYMFRDRENEGFYLLGAINQLIDNLAQNMRDTICDANIDGEQ